MPAKPIDPGKPYAGVPRLARFLKLVGDIPQDAQAPGSETYGDQSVRGSQTVPAAARPG